MPNDNHAILALAKDLASRAGELILSARARADFTAAYKAESEPVTSADLDCEKLIVSGVQSAFPDHNFLAEEQYSKGGSGTLPSHLWIIDPIDGTRNFARGHAHVASSIAYAREGVITAAVVHAPFLNETFSAIKGEGAWLNGQKIAASSVNNLGEALIATGFPYPHQKKGRTEELLKKFRFALAEGADIRRAGAASLDLCWLAAGRVDAFYEDLNPWDFAAGLLIASEAGAQCRAAPAPNTTSRWPAELQNCSIAAACPGIFKEFILGLDRASASA